MFYLAVFSEISHLEPQSIRKIDQIILHDSSNRYKQNTLAGEIIQVLVSERG